MKDNQTTIGVIMALATSLLIAVGLVSALLFGGPYVMYLVDKTECHVAKNYYSKEHAKYVCGNLKGEQ